MQVHPGGGIGFIGDPSLFDLFLGEMVPLSRRIAVTSPCPRSEQVVNPAVVQPWVSGG